MSNLPTIDSLRKSIEAPLDRVKTLDDLDKLRVAWLGRSGKLTAILKSLGAASMEERKTKGKAYNELKVELEGRLTEREKLLLAAQRAADLEKDALDTTLPGTARPFGTAHPLSQVMREMVDIFRKLGFVVADGPEIESEFNNFDALNIPPNHPARDMHDTFYLDLTRRQLALPAL